MPEVKTNSLQKLDDVIAITGIQRSGTSILGKLIGSFETIEYSYEPRLIYHLDSLIDSNMVQNEFIIELLGTYLFHDHFIEKIHGRRYNFRFDDISYILGMKSLGNVMKRWKSISGYDDAVLEINNHNYAFKFTGGYSLISELCKTHPNVKIVHVWRSLDRILPSMFEKNWFTDENLCSEYFPQPHYKMENNVIVPYLVDHEAIDQWESMNIETRTVHICNQLAGKRADFRNNFVNYDTYYEIKFDQFVCTPSSAAYELSSFLELNFGPKTEYIINEINPTNVSHDIDDILEKTDSVEAEKFREYRQSETIHL